MSERRLLQYGWISGPVECCCSHCDWSWNFMAVDTSVPNEVLSEFENHDCKRHAAIDAAKLNRESVCSENKGRAPQADGTIRPSVSLGGPPSGPESA